MLISVEILNPLLKADAHAANADLNHSATGDSRAASCLDSRKRTVTKAHRRDLQTKDMQCQPYQANLAK